MSYKGLSTSPLVVMKFSSLPMHFKLRSGCWLSIVSVVRKRGGMR